MKIFHNDKRREELIIARVRIGKTLNTTPISPITLPMNYS